MVVSKSHMGNPGEHLANWRSKRLQMPYGDQAIFVEADVFRAIGSFTDMPVMSDYDLMHRPSHHCVDGSISSSLDTNSACHLPHWHAATGERETHIL